MAFVERAAVVAGEGLGKGKTGVIRHGRSIEQAPPSAHGRQKYLPVHILYPSFETAAHPEFPESVDAQHKGCPHFPPTGTKCEETILLAAQTLLYHSYTITIFEIEGRWSAHGNEESSEEACQEGGG